MEEILVLLLYLEGKEYKKESILSATLMKRKFQTDIGTVQFRWAFEHDKGRNVKGFEVWRSTDSVPHTVLIHDYDKRGDKQFFSDIFWSDDWDASRGAEGVTDEIKFLCQLWQDLGLKEIEGEDFQPKHVVFEHDRFPTVYRNTLENVMAQQFGCGHSRELTQAEMEEEPVQQPYVDPADIIRIPLVFNGTESYDELASVVAKGVGDAVGSRFAPKEYMYPADAPCTYCGGEADDSCDLCDDPACKPCDPDAKGWKNFGGDCVICPSCFEKQEERLATDNEVNWGFDEHYYIEPGTVTSYDEWKSGPVDKTNC
jgi:hypothetical protein